MAKSAKPVTTKQVRKTESVAKRDWELPGGEGWSEASGPDVHVKPSHQDEAHAPRRKTLDLEFPSWCLGDVCATDVKAVSYTHLDVYKRQLQRRTTSSWYGPPTPAIWRLVKCAKACSQTERYAACLLYTSRCV